VMGEARGMDYLRRFAAQAPVFVAASPRAVLDQVIAGEYPLGLMMYNHHAAISAGKGAPVQWLKLEPLVALQSLIGILRDAPHPNAARALTEFILSPDGQQVTADNDYLPADPDIPARIATLKPEAGHFKVTLLRPKLVHDDLPRWRTIFHEVFR
jgi:ABC-type Fe3+ transport system substrate-binding protein